MEGEGCWPASGIEGGAAISVETRMEENLNSSKFIKIENFFVDNVRWRSKLPA